MNALNHPPELEILENLVKHARKLALTPDPQKRIIASRWEIFFQAELEKAKAGAMKQAELFSVVGHHGDDEDEALKVAED